jgi:carboxypeptidase C (cathepsin A)
MDGMKLVCACVLAVLLSACGGGGGNNNPAPAAPPPPPGITYTDPVLYSSAATASLPSAQEITAVTRHQIVLGGSTLNYTATAGHLTALSLAGAQPEASFFYVAYTLDGADPATRPVTFFYNGGPGSATVWLHLGSFGPKRLVTNAPSTTTPLPFAFVDNTESLLDKSDLVFVDAVSTGLSEAIAPNVNSTFWGVDADAAVFRDFVMRYVAVNNRGASPKFLFGESYGTPRSAVLASLLESAGTSLTGVVLQSSILNYNTNCGIFVKVTISCAPYLPSYGAIGAWLNLTQPAHPVAQLPDFMAQMRTVASAQYDPAARAFLATQQPPDPTLVTLLANDTGMAAAQWNVHFNMDDTYFHDNLVPGSVIGFYDGRMVATMGTPLASQDDPSSTFYNASFAAQIVQYLGQLNYTTPSTYVLLSNALNSWNFAHGGLQVPDTIPDLAAAMAHNPKLKVFSANGWYDIVTPFYLTEQDIARLGGNPNITIRFYQGGHMTYLDDTGRTAEKADFAAFYQSTAKQAVVPSVAAPLAAVTPASSAVSPPASFETTKRDPALPERLQSITPAPPTIGDALAAQVVERLREEFEAAPQAKRGGPITREQARAAGLGFVANNFDAIDVNHTGAVTFDDVLRFMRAQGAKLPD